MTQPRVPLWGGPLDGHSIAARAETFVWIAPGGVGVRAFEKAGPGRLLYRREGANFVYAALTYALCSKCDNPQPKTDDGRCGLCKEALIPA